MEKKKLFPFSELGERWELSTETMIRPNSTWSMHRTPYRYDYSHYSYTQTLPDDLKDLVANDIVIVKQGELVELERNTHFGSAYDKFPQGRPRVYEQPHDAHAHFHLLSCDCKYLLRIQAAVQSHHFAIRTFERTVRVKYAGRAMIDGTTRAIMREEEMMNSWTRDFTRIYGGDRS